MKSYLGLTVSLAALMAATSVSAQTVADAAKKGKIDQELEEIVVTGTRGVAAEVAPSKASLATTQPQSIVSRSFIEQAVSLTGDSTSIIALTPSAGGASAANGPGLGEAKNTLRGFQDGDFNQTFDGIPYGDTNGPSHHSTSFFPAAVIGQVIVDRGPGAAGDLGQANYGGNVQLRSLNLTDDFRARTSFTYGSWNTKSSTTQVQSGEIKQLNNARIAGNFFWADTDGALSGSLAHETNEMIKAEIPFSDRWKATLYANHNEILNYRPDVSKGITLTQAALYGKDFWMTTDKPGIPTYYKYSPQFKRTDFEYIRLEGKLDNGWSVENQPYTYYYSNKTRSVYDSFVNYPYGGNYNLGSTYSTVNQKFSSTGIFSNPNLPFPATGTTQKGDIPTGIPGYDKLNRYRVIGDITRVNKDFSFGQIRAGLWLEKADTDRHNYDLDMVTGNPNYDLGTRLICNVGTKNNCGATFSTPRTDVVFFEKSGWVQYQPFVDFEWHATERLTITPGLKYMFDRIAVLGLPIKSPSGYSNTAETYKKFLRFLNVNYKYQDNWSFYAQYATGMRVPDISAQYSTNVALTHPNPQLTTNYQVGTVYNTEHLNLDFDVYFIDAKNLIQSDTIGGDTVVTNFGGGIFKGIEGEATYAFDNGLAVFANGSYNYAENRRFDPVRFPGVNNSPIPKAPVGTLAGGAMYSIGGFTGTVFEKWNGRQYNANGKLGLIKAYDELNVTLIYKMEHVRFQVGIYNVLDHRDVTASSQKTVLPSATDQFVFQPSRNYQATVRFDY
jgi:iron complex outermembrane receptor protein